MPTTHGYFAFGLRIDSRQQRLKTALARLKGRNFDAIAIRGMSGAVIGIPLAWALKKPVIIVRKSEDEDSRSHGDAIEVEADTPIQTFVLVDDFISTGRSSTD